MRQADDFGNKASALVLRNEVRAWWSPGDAALIYRVDTGPDSTAFIQVDLETGTKAPAFDAIVLASALAKAAGKMDIDPNKLPLEQVEIAVDSRAVRFRAFEKSWRFNAADGEVSADTLPPKGADLMAPEAAAHGTRRNGERTDLTIENATDGELEMFWVNDRGERKSYGKVAAGQAAVQHTYAGHVWLMTTADGRPLAGVEASDAPSVARIAEPVKSRPRRADDVSPDGNWRASIQDNNLLVFPTAGGDPIRLSTDGTDDDRFTGPIRWSPDSNKIVAFRVKPVKTRQVHIVQSSPPDQLQPKLKTLDYAKPGDPISQPMPHLFDLAGQREIPIDHALFDNPWEISNLAWNQDSSEFSFVYNQRGHQVMRIVGVRADSGSARTLFEDRSKTFIDYSQKFFMRRLAETNEILWTSERDGHNHLYLLDSVSGEIKQQITRGDWEVREVVEVDEMKRELRLKVMGMTGQDPYHEHFVRVKFDASDFTQLTASDGNHSIEFSPNKKFLLDTWSRVDQPPVVELRRADNGTLVAELERADDSALVKTGWSRPERFSTKGRDGKTDIYGIIIRPTHFDPTKIYPLVENIYAGPHDYFVPKSYFPWSGMNAMAELGFVLVKMDGMGTNWRGKAFHDVCWKNLADGGFPDRIPWIQAAAAGRPWMDLTRVGIYGGSAGGQNALAGLLFHGDFYHVGVADCGCHDNRMDKTWWNEAWMGWPVDESYARNSNVTHADKLTGKLMLVVGEMDSNVDPASTAQVVGALQKADKDFEFLPIINANHGAAESPYGKRRRAQFLVDHLGAE
jgi:dipeptidyl-peptidase-4